MLLRTIHVGFNVESNELDITFLQGDNIRLGELLTFDDQRGSATWFALPGQDSDGASIPRLFWRLLGHPFHGPFRRAAILHDAYYRLQYAGISRRAIDLMLYDALLHDGCPKWKAAIIYASVRAGGWRAWGQNAKKLSSGREGVRGESETA